jgi:transposase InsO family protein
LYLAIVLDVYSRRVVGWAMANHLRTEPVLDAFNMAIFRRKPSNVIHHSDQSCQYTSIAFGKRWQEAGVRPSMGSVGDCYDNAMCESFNATLECELLAFHRFKTQREAAAAIFDFIGLVQPPSQTLSARLSPTQQLRAANGSSRLMSKNYLSTKARQLQPASKPSKFTLMLGTAGKNGLACSIQGGATARLAVSILPFDR